MADVRHDGFGTIFATGATPTEPSGGAYTSGGGGANTVVWAPFPGSFPDPLASGWNRDWGTAIAAVNALPSADAVLQIMANPNDDEPVLPGGTWLVNKPTILAGLAYDADTDTNYRGQQSLIYVSTEGDANNPCKLPGFIGLKDMYFRSNENNSNVVTTEDFETIPGDNSTEISIPVSSLVGFELYKLAYINGAGYYRVTAISEGSVTFKNPGIAGNTDPANTVSAGATIYPDNAVFYNSTWKSHEFTLDNADFHFGNYRFGSFHVDVQGPPDGENSGDQWITLKNGASTRWYAFRVDGYALFTTDGSGCWIGSSAFFGDGNVDIYPMAGCQVRPYQPVINSWNQHQPTIPYIVGDTSHWNGTPPATVHEALDRISAAIASATTGPIS